jgi:hypothetical protein
MTNFYIRKFEYTPPITEEISSYTNLPMFTLPNSYNFGDFTQTEKSIFDLQNLKEAYILASSSGIGTQFFGSPFNPYLFRVKQISDDYSTPTYGRFIDGELGDSARKIVIFKDLASNSSLLNPTFKDSYFFGVYWELAGYDTSTESNFLNDVCSQINLAIQLYQPLTLYNNFNVFVYKRLVLSIIEPFDYIPTYTILYYPGADPNADEVISI